MKSGGLRDAPLGRKLLVIALVSSAVTLILLSIVLIARGAIDARSRAVTDLETSAAMIGANAAPAVMFDDGPAASDTLAALAAKPNIVYGAIHNPQGKLVAEYRGARDIELLPVGEGRSFGLRSIALSRPIVFKGEALGTIVLQSDLTAMYGGLLRDAGLILLAALLAFGVGTALLLRFLKALVDPIRALAEAMHGVSERQNYTVRVPVAGSDEVGVLSRTFNTMLERIQTRDAELATYSEHLEAEVAARTAQLQEANTWLERSRGQIELLSNMAATLQTCLAQEEVGTVVGPFLERLLPGSSGGVYLVKNSRNVVEVGARWGAAPPDLMVFPPNDCWAIRRGQMHVVDEALTAPRCAHGRTEVRCQACAPMMAQGEMLGILHAESRAGPVSPVDQALLQRVAGEVAQALANLRYRDALKRMAIRDPLTGLFNRRYLEEYLAMEITRSMRNQQHLGLVLVDIDHFKAFNDSYGHEAGDEVLCEVGKLFMRHIRDGDAACRYGGEEFVLAMWECPPEAARTRAEALREDVKKLQVRIGQRALGGITLSAGVAVFPDHGTTAEEVLRAADRALYTAKLAGRDRVCVAGLPTPSEG
jgi:diguanylate cyclase (GGDEF)-like protein